MSFGVADAPLVRIGRVELAGQAKSGGRFLRQPPGILAVAAVAVIAAAAPIHGGDVDRVAPHVFERAVVSAVAADLSVAVELAADDPQLLAAHTRPIVADAFDLGALLARGFARLSAGIGRDLRGD